MINATQLYARQPYSTLTGTELVVIDGASGTGASVLTTLKNFFKAGFVANDVSNATTVGKQLMTVADVAAAKTLLEVPTLPTPLAPMTLSANTTLSATHVNRRLFVNTAAIALTLNAAVVANTDTIKIINVSSGTITLNAGAGEDMILWAAGAGTTVTTYTVPVNYCITLYRVDANTWFIEY